MSGGIRPHTRKELSGPRWTYQKCRACVRALQNGLPLRNACGRARLPYRATQLFLQKGEREAEEFFQDETMEEMSSAAEFFIEVQWAIGKRIEARLKLYDKAASGEDYVKNWQREIEMLKRYDPESWQLAAKTPPTTVINNNNNQANLELPPPEKARLNIAIKDGPEWNGKVMEAIPGEFEEDAI